MPELALFFCDGNIHRIIGKEPNNGQLQLLFAPIIPTLEMHSFIFPGTGSSAYCNHETIILGSFAHSTRYIQTVTETFNIKIFAKKRQPIRKDHAKWIEGDLFICELP